MDDEQSEVLVLAARQLDGNDFQFTVTVVPSDVTPRGVFPGS
jgi:hypothetical protein